MNSKDHEWYHSTIASSVPPEARKILVEYSHIPAKDVDAHIYKIRDAAWEIAPFPCIGQFRFLSLNLSRHPLYGTVLDLVKNGASLLDLGCCVGQDIRKLIFDGAPPRELYGSDLFAGYIDVGYQLFCDKNSCGAKFITANVFDGDSPLRELTGRIDIVHASLFLHLFDWKRQLDVVTRIINLLKAQPGSVLLGAQVGATIAGERLLQHKKVAYLHDPESFQQLWREAEALTRTTWEVRAEAVALREEQTRRGFFGSGTTWLRFSAKRL